MCSRIGKMRGSTQVVRTEWTSDDGCVVVMRLPKAALREAGFKALE